MSLPVKPNSLQTYQVVLYRRALHPELFTLKGRASVNHGAYELEAWLMPGAHLLRFQHKGFCACELLTDQEDGLPTEGAVTTFPCAGERDYEHRFADQAVSYMTAVQTETLSENLYAATYRDMVEFADELKAVRHAWRDAEGGMCLGVLDIQRYNREIHAQCYHLIAQGGLVLRSQTIFEHA